MIPSRLLIGVDCGGTKTQAVLGDADGRVLGKGAAGPANFQVMGVQAAVGAIRTAIEAAFRQASLPAGPVHVLCVGMAGADRPQERELLMGRLQELAVRVELFNDVRLLLAAGTPLGWGLAVISGTGSIVYGLDAGGRTARAGGWGYLFGDEGSGYDLGRSALQAAARQADGRGPETLLTRKILDYWGLQDVSSLIPHVYRQPAAPAEIARLAPLVGEACEQGDPVAAGLVQRAAEELSLGVRAVAAKLGFEGQVACAMGGGVLAHLPGLRDKLVALTREAGLQLDPAVLVTEPVEGALRLARSLADPG